jgi:Flp pilus assembly pilin Flp
LRFALDAAGPSVSVEKGAVYRYASNHIRRFVADRDAAITIDWVVLSASVIILVVLAGEPIFNTVKSSVESIASEIASLPVGL